MKEKISLYLVATVKRIGALWVGVLVSIVPLYILRSYVHDLDDLAIVEYAVNPAIILLTSAVCMFLLYWRDDHASKLNNKETLLLVFIPTLIHFLICFITAFTKNLIVISTGCGYLFVYLLEPDIGKEVAELPARLQILASLIITPIPAIGVFFGCLAARKKRQKEVAQLHREGEIRRS